MTDKEIIEGTREKVDKIIKEDELETAKKYGTKEDVKDIHRDDIIKYLNDNPDVAKEIVEKFTPKEEAKENHQNRIFRKFAPYVFVGMAILSSIGGVVGGAKFKEKQIDNNTIQIPQSYESNYKSIEDAPIEIQIAYIEAQDDNYRDSLKNDSNLRNEEFENIISRYGWAKEKYELAKKNNSKQEEINALAIIGQCADIVNKIAYENPDDKIVRFENSEFAEAVLNEKGEIFFRIHNEDDLSKNGEVVLHNGGLYKGK